MYSARLTTFLLLYRLLYFSVSKAGQPQPSSSSHTMTDNSSSVFVFYDMETIPMPVDTTAIYIIPSSLDVSSNVLFTSEHSALLPVSSPHITVATIPFSLGSSMPSLMTSPSITVATIPSFSISSSGILSTSMPSTPSLMSSPHITVATPTTSIISLNMTTATIVVTSIVVGTTEKSSGDGGTIAAIVVSILLLVAGAVIVVLTVLVIYTRRKKRIRRYSFNHSFRSTETDRSRIYINVTAATNPQQHCDVENGNQNKEGSTFNQYTGSPANDSSYHIYEMTEISDDEALGDCQEPQDDEVLGDSQEPDDEALKDSQEPQETAKAPDKTPNSTPSHQKRTAYKPGSGSYKSKKSPYRKRLPPRRYNTVSEYEFMMPQLKAAAAVVANKRATMPADTTNAYSEISDDDGEPQQNDPTYIFMKTEGSTDELSSFLFKKFDLDKDKDTDADQTNTTTGQPLSEASEEDVYITMQ